MSSHLTQSIRARYSQRFKETKEKSKDEALGESRTLIKQRPRREMRSTRFDDALLRDELTFEELEKKMSVRDKWKHASSKATKQPLLPSDKDSFDFFTRTWEDQDEAEDVKIKETPSTSTKATDQGEATEDENDEERVTPAAEDNPENATEGETETPEGKEDDEVPLLDDIEDDGPDSWKKYYRVARAQYVPFREKLEVDKGALFVPPETAAPVKDKIFEQPEPRYLEDEGFYVGKRPAVTQTNVNKMENRLLKEPELSKDWFGEDGKLIMLPDPLKEISDRPAMLEIIDEPSLQTEYRKAEVYEIESQLLGVDVMGHYQLDIDINSLNFSHHHLFSREHVLASKLSELYQQYALRSQRNMAFHLTGKLKAIKTSTAHIQQNIIDLKTTKTDTQSIEKQEKRLAEYKRQIMQTRKELDEENNTDRTLLRSILNCWKEIKSLRSFQQCTNTPVKLQIKKETCNKEDDKAAWDADISDELEEMREEAEDKYQQELAQYKHDLDEWKKQKLQKKDAKKRQKQRRSRSALSQDEELEEEEDERVREDESLLQMDDLQKPEKPQFPSDDNSRAVIEAKYSKTRRKPGEPKLFVELTYGATITDNKDCPRGEQQRRNDVNHLKLFVKVFFNDKEVKRTEYRPLGQDFIVRFAQIFHIEVMQWPRSIKLEVYESSGLSSVLLTEVYVSIPASHITIDNFTLDNIEFSTFDHVAHRHEGVGSGVSFSMDANKQDILTLMTTAALTTGVAWAVDETGHVMAPVSSQTPIGGQRVVDPVAAIGMTGMADMDQLSKWIADSHLDPNDPNNADLMHMMKPSEDEGNALMWMPQHYRLEQLQEEFNFSTDEKLNSSPRFKMLLNRACEDPAFINKQVPALDKEVRDVYAEQVDKKDKVKKDAIEDIDMDPHRKEVRRFMERVKEQVTLRFRSASHQKSLTDMVHEEMVPNISNILPSLAKLAEPRRPLKPIRHERKKVTAQNLGARDVNILVNIVRAFGIPVREDSQPRQAEALGPGAAPRQTTTNNAPSEVSVRPFIEVSFQRERQATSVAEGPNPSWNEELQIPFKPPNNDYSSTNLQTVTDNLFISLFDEYIIDVVHEGQQGNSIQRRIEKRWLGDFKIPFSTIYFNSRIDGTFRISKPPVLLGYTFEGQHSQRHETTGMEVGMGSPEHTYLTMFITIEPSLAPAEPMVDTFDSHEEESLRNASDAWLGDLLKKYPKREYRTLVVDINGKSVFMTRFFKALRPPEELIRDSPYATCETLLRYVSMIPAASDSVVFPGLCDIWSTCDQFLRMLQGDEEEHAVLLCNYFLHLGKQAWLLLGSAVPEGPTAYVLTQEENNDYRVWNAITGQHFSFRDSYCPVQSVGCLANADNIWANIQPYEQPSRLSYDLSNTSQWRPFFGKSFPNPGLGSVQPESLYYIPTETSYVQRLQDRIERVLKERMKEWRPRLITRWNRHCVASFRQLLKKLEENRGQKVQQEHSGELKNVLGSYKMCGFPINQPFSHIDPLVEAVFATGVHKQETSDVEFALAVHIHPYPNLVLSVWIYIASLTRKQ